VTHPGISHCHPVSPDSAHVIVGNGAPLAVTHTGTTSVPTNADPLRLNNIILALLPFVPTNSLSVALLCHPSRTDSLPFAVVTDSP
jgi:hypothetical protein